MFITCTFKLFNLKVIIYYKLSKNNNLFSSYLSYIALSNSSMSLFGYYLLLKSENNTVK